MQILCRKTFVSQPFFGNSTISMITFVALRRFVWQSHVVNVIYVVCRLATLFAGVVLFFISVSFSLRRRVTEPLPKSFLHLILVQY